MMPTQLPDRAADAARRRMLRHAERLVDIVHSGDLTAVDPVLRTAAAAPMPDGADPIRHLVVALAGLALVGPADADDIAVERAVDGRLPWAELNQAERGEVVRRLRARGWPVIRISEHLGINWMTVAGVLGNVVRHQPARAQAAS